MKIPFVDLYAQYLSIKAEIDDAISRTIKDSSYIGGQSTDFENAFAKYTSLKNVIGCGNGTDSIEILLKVFGIKEGDEVIVPALSWISTSEAVSSIGAIPVFVDIEKDFFSIDASLIEQKITARTKAIIPVHLYGHPANMPAIMEIANKYKLFVIEDCAQAHGAMINGQLVGTFGQAASFSFYPGKNLGAYGDAGCMATNDDVIAGHARMIANHGQKGKHNHLMEGRNSRLDGLQGAILLAKLPHLAKWTEARIANALIYNELLGGKEVDIPIVKDNCRHVFHLYVVRVKNRNQLRAKLTEANIETFIHYPTALPFLPCYQKDNHQPAEFPVAYACQNTILSLPMYPELSWESIATVAQLL